MSLFGLPAVTLSYPDMQLAAWTPNSRTPARRSNNASAVDTSSTFPCHIVKDGSQSWRHRQRPPGKMELWRVAIHADKYTESTTRASKRWWTL